MAQLKLYAIFLGYALSLLSVAFAVFYGSDTLALVLVFCVAWFFYLLQKDWYKT